MRISGTLLIRADASTQIGTGHVMRCLALAQRWQDDGERAVFALATSAPALETRLQSEGMELVRISAAPGTPDDARQTSEAARQRGASWVAVDGYQFGAEYQRALKESGTRLLFLDDDGHAGQYCADLVLNQNIAPPSELYASREPFTRLLLGTRYVLLRREFRRWSTRRRGTRSVARRVLVTLGGSDPDNTSLKARCALQRIDLPGLQAKIIIGPSNPYFDALREQVAHAACDLELVTGPTSMPDLMAWADVAIAAGGTTCWELAFMGVPSVVVALADNQRRNTRKLGELGIATDLGDQADCTAPALAVALQELLSATERRREMARRGQELVDGDGVDRVLQCLQTGALELRRADWSDCRRLWEWANDPEVRARSFSREPIPWRAHVRWLEGKLQDPDCLLLIAQSQEGIPLGQVRFERSGTEAVISISLDGGFRGKGHGSMLVRCSSRELFDTTDVTVIHAYARPDNQASIRAFAKAGFQNVGSACVNGCDAVHLLLQREEL